MTTLKSLNYEVFKDYSEDYKKKKLIFRKNKYLMFREKFSDTVLARFIYKIETSNVILPYNWDKKNFEQKISFIFDNSHASLYNKPHNLYSQKNFQDKESKKIIKFLLSNEED